jgi:hypothetical protein
VPALFGEKQPFQLSVDHLFSHPDKFIGIKGDVWWILVTSPIRGFLCGQVVPLFAGNLAASAGSTNRRINEK